MSLSILERPPVRGRRFWLLFAGLWFALGLGLRMFIAVQLPEEPLNARLIALLAGFVNDAQSLVLAFAWLSIGFLVSSRWFVRLWLGIALAIVGLLFIAEIFYWLEFQSRLDRLVFHYLRYPREVLAFLEEQFHLSLFALPFVLAIWLLTRWMVQRLPERFGSGQRALPLLWVSLGAAALAFATPGPPGHSRHLNQLASNGYLGVLTAARLDATRWQGAYWTPTGSEDASPAPAKPPPSAGCGGRISGPGFRHLLLVIEESFGGRFWWDLENRARYMPSLQAFAERGLYFDSVYATGSRTTRGMEAILNGYPPLPGIALTQRPGFESLPSLPRELAAAGFRTAFVYGGWPDFSNFFNYWRGIGFQEMLSRYDFEDRWFETSWGVPDELLFERALAEMDRLTDAQDRVMMATLTVTNHRPFDFPDGRIPYPAEARRQEYAIAYADWALGEFLEQAEERAWFPDTLIVVVADHGPLLDGPALVPANSYRVPLLLYNPRQIAPAAIRWHGSTMSLPLTLLDCLDLRPTQGFYGASLLAGGNGLAPVEQNYHVGLLAPDRLTLLVRGGSLLGWRYDGRTLTPDEPDLDQARRSEALFRSAHERFYGAPLLLP